MRILQIIEDASDLPVRALYSDKTENQIIYKLIPLTDNGVIRTDRLELNIAVSSLEEAEEVDRKIRDALLSAGDLKKNGVQDIYINGGGTLLSDVAVHRLVNYIVVMGVK